LYGASSCNKAPKCKYCRRLASKSRKRQTLQPWQPALQCNVSAATLPSYAEARTQLPSRRELNSFQLPKVHNPSPDPLSATKSNDTKPIRPKAKSRSHLVHACMSFQQTNHSAGMPAPVIHTACCGLFSVWVHVGQRTIMPLTSLPCLAHHHPEAARNSEQSARLPGRQHIPTAGAGIKHLETFPQNHHGTSEAATMCAMPSHMAYCTQRTLTPLACWLL
jgi:hypothetical protein